MHVDAILEQRHNQATGQAIANPARSFNPALLDTPAHGGHQTERGRDGQAFKEFSFACCVFRRKGDGGVESSETSDAAADEYGEDERVGCCA